ncbi:MAG: hypothetical protein WCO78_01565 [Candidatus Roizmanbacteria bacterium]
MSNYFKKVLLLTVFVLLFVPAYTHAADFEKNSEGAMEFTSSKMASSVHRIKLVPTNTLSKEEFLNIFVLGCVTNDRLKGDIVVGSWTFSNLTGDVCTTGTQTHDVLWCNAEYRSAPTGYCDAVANAKWKRLGRISYGLEGSQPQLKNGKAFSCLADTFCNDGSMELSPTDSIEWQQKNGYHETLNWFYAVGYFTPVVTADVPVDGNSPKIKDQIFKPSNQVNVIKYRFDPYGYVFDAQTLEPLANVPVYLFEKWQPVVSPTPPAALEFYNNLSDNNIGVASVQNTLATGSFAFVIANGTYALDVLTAAPDQTLPYTSRANSVLVDASQASAVRGAKQDNGTYKVFVTVDQKSKELYTELYPTNAATIEDIVQANGKIQRRDLPVTASKIGVSATRPLTVINETNARNNDAGLYVFGTVSHPYTLVEAVIDGVVQPITTRATIDGTWGFTIPTDTITPVSVVTVKLTKPAFYSSVLGVSTDSVVAKGDGLEISIPVMPRYIDAIAKSDAGAVLPLTEVRVIDETDGQITYTTKTDETGRFLIPPHGLSAFRYRLEYGSGATLRTVKTTDIFAENKTYLASKAINPFSAVEAEKVEVLTYSQSTPSATLSTAPISPTVIQPSQALTNISGVPVTPSAAVSKQPTRPVGQLAQIFVYIAILILLVGVTALLVMYYLKRRQDPHMYDASQPPPSAPMPPTA